jgi:predicted RNase H-like HicB family nuclease
MEITVLPDPASSGFWATYRDGVQVWAWGRTKEDARKRLLEFVPYPYETGDPTHAFESFQDFDETLSGYACWQGFPEVVTTADTEDEAIEVLIAHVPVPPPSNRPVTSRPPKLEDSPLPPV